MLSGNTAVIDPVADALHTTESKPRPKRRITLLIALLLAVGTVILYLPAVRNGFVNFDDTDYVTRNTHVLQGLTWSNVIWAFGTNNPAANWHPLTWISHMWDVQWYGTNPAGHHLTNLLLHAWNVMLLFLLLARVTGERLRSAAVAVIFALHPLNVESVAWVAERKAVLCVFFLLLTLWAYGWYVRKPSVARYLCVMLFFALGLLSKIMVVALPFALLLLDYWPLRRFGYADTSEFAEAHSALSNFLRLVAEKIPLLLLAFAGACMTIYMHRKDRALSAVFPLSWRIKNVLYSYVVYFGKAIWPTRLAVFYPHPENSLSWWTAILAGLVLVASSVIVWQLKTKRYLLVGWLWYLGTMLPMIGIVQSGRQGMADRYMYIPIIGLLVAAVWLFADLAARLQLRRGFAITIFGLLLIPYIYLTEMQIGYWRNSYTLFSHALEVTQNNGIAENNLGSALMEMGKPQLAAPHFEAAVQFIPDLASAHYNLGVLFQLQNRLEDAATQYHVALTVSSDPLEEAQAHNNLGILYLTRQDYPAALQELNAAITLNPNEQNSYIGRGQIEMQSWNLDAAVADFTHAAKIASSPVAYFWLGRALETKGDYQPAASAYAAALQLAPHMAEARTRWEALRTRANQ